MVTGLYSFGRSTCTQALHRGVGRVGVGGGGQAARGAKRGRPEAGWDPWGCGKRVHTRGRGRQGASRTQGSAAALLLGASSAGCPHCLPPP